MSNKNQAFRGNIKKKYTAFSLIELSIVLTIIGILIAGALNASTVIVRMRLSNARTLTEESPVKNISGLIAWYETTLDSSFENSVVVDSYTDDPSSVKKWYDTSKGSLSLRKATNNQMLGPIDTSSSVSYEKNGINKMPSFRFGGNGGLKLSSFRNGALSSASIFIVLQPTNIDTTERDVFGGAGSSNYLTISTSRATINRGSSLDIATNIFGSQAPVIFALYESGTSGIYANSVNTLLGSGNAGSNSLNGIYLGERNGGSSNDFEGLISEVIIFNGTIKASDRREVMNYLSKKYNITVADL